MRHHFSCLLTFLMFVISYSRWQDKSIFVLEGERAILPFKEIDSINLDGSTVSLIHVSASNTPKYRFKIHKYGMNWKVQDSKYKFDSGSKMWILDQKIKFFPSNGKNSSSFQIFQAQKNDSGHYLCKYEKKGEKNIQYKIYLSVEDYKKSITSEKTTKESTHIGQASTSHATASPSTISTENSTTRDTTTSTMATKSSLTPDRTNFYPTATVHTSSATPTTPSPTFKTSNETVSPKATSTVFAIPSWLFPEGLVIIFIIVSIVVFLQLFIIVKSFLC